MGEFNIMKTVITANMRTLPTIIPGLQNRSVISVVSGSNQFCALTSSGTLSVWGSYFGTTQMVGDPGELPAGTLGGYTKEE